LHHLSIIYDRFVLLTCDNVTFSYTIKYESENSDNDTSPTENL